MLIGQIQHVATGRRDNRPEGDAHRPARRNPHAVAKREDGIENGADGIGKRPAIHYGDRRSNFASTAEETGPVGFDLRLAHRLAFDDGKMCRPDFGLGRRATPPRRQDGADLGEILSLHEKFGKDRVRRVGGGRRQHQLCVGGELDVPGLAARIRDRYAADFGVVLWRDDNVEGRGDRSVAPGELGAILGERDFVTVRFDAARLIARGPQLAALHVAQEHVGAPVVAGDVFAPARDRKIAPAAVSGTGARQHHCIPAVRKQMRLRRGAVRGAEPPHRRELQVADRRCRLDFLRPGMSYRDIARRAFLQQKFRRLHDWLGMKPFPHLPVEETVGDGDHRHALMVRQEGADNCDVFPLGQARACVIQRLVEAIAAPRAQGGESGEVTRRRARINHGRERRRVGRDDGVLAKAAFQTQTRDSEVRILIGEFQITDVVGGLRNPPRHTERGAISDLPADDETARLLEQTAGRCAHDERRHQILEHRSRPGDERRAASDRRDGASEPEPVPRGDFALGDCHETRKARLGGEQVVAARVENALRGPIADREELALWIEEKAEFHRAGHGPRRLLERRQAPFQGVGGVGALCNVATVTLDRP